MSKKNDRNQFPDAVSRTLKGGFTVTLPYGGGFVAQNNGAYMCVGTERDGRQPIFRVEGIDLGDDGVVLNRKNVISPVALSEFLKAHENLTRGLEHLGDVAAPIQKHGEWLYYVHENPETKVNSVTALKLGHYGVLDVRCMKEDIFFTLDCATAED